MPFAALTRIIHPNLLVNKTKGEISVIFNVFNNLFVEG